MDNDTIIQTYSEGPNFTCTHFYLCLFLSNFITCVILYIHHYGQGLEQFHSHKDPCITLFLTIPTLRTTNLLFISKIMSFQKCFIRGWGHSSVAGHLPSIERSLGSVPSTTK
jgi:hypothetical protein